mgnify:CR=1 FL=1
MSVRTCGRDSKGVNGFGFLLFRNNSSVNKKKSKKGFVKDFTSNNLSGSNQPPAEPSLAANILRR